MVLVLICKAAGALEVKHSLYFQILSRRPKRSEPEKPQEMDEGVSAADKMTELWVTIFFLLFYH